MSDIKIIENDWKKIKREHDKINFFKASGFVSGVAIVGSLATLAFADPSVATKAVVLPVVLGSFFASKVGKIASQRAKDNKMSSFVITHGNKSNQKALAKLTNKTSLTSNKLILRGVGAFSGMLAFVASVPLVFSTALTQHVAISIGLGCLFFSGFKSQEIKDEFDKANKIKENIVNKIFDREITKSENEQQALITENLNTTKPRPKIF